MSDLLEEMRLIASATTSRTDAIVTYMKLWSANNDVSLGLSLKEHADSIESYTGRLGSLTIQVIVEIDTARQKNSAYVMSQSVIELFATIIDYVQTENALLRKLTILPVEARHLFFQAGDSIIEAISSTVKEHG